jgi:hypothetical protein
MDSSYDKYASLTIPALKTELKKRNARLSGRKKVSGRKKELIERFVVLI